MRNLTIAIIISALFTVGYVGHKFASLQEQIDQNRIMIDQVEKDIHNGFEILEELIERLEARLDK